MLIITIEDIISFIIVGIILIGILILWTLCKIEDFKKWKKKRLKEK